MSSKSTKDPNAVRIAGVEVPSALYSGIMTAAGAAAIGLGVYLAARAANIVSSKLMYHALVFGAFFGLYMVMPGGFNKNFNSPGKATMTVADVIYYTFTVHTSTGFGEFTPMSFYSRCVVAAHMGLAFVATAGLIPLE